MSVQRIVRTLLLVLVVGRCATAGAVEIAALRQHHPWARFRPGSWKQVRLATETLDAEGKVTTTSIARTRTTLSSVGDDGVTLKVEATIELAGKQIESEPQVVKQGWHGDVADRETTIEDLGEDQLTIAGANPLSRRAGRVAHARRPDRYQDLVLRPRLSLHPAAREHEL